MKYSIALFSFIILLGCTKEKSQYYYINGQIANALNMQAGSYFIYKDSATLNLDTIIINSYTDVLVERGNFPTDYYEQIQVNTEEKDENFYSFITGAPVTDTPSRITAYIVSDTDTTEGRVFYNKEAFLILELPFIKDKVGFVYPDCYTTFLEHYDSLKIGNKTYQNVYESISSSSSGLVFHSYFSLESGIIKYSIKRGDNYYSYDLIDSKIIRK